MEITEKYINKQLDYLKKINDNSYEKLVDTTLTEQGMLSTFIQQNLDNIFPDNEEIKDFTYNLYFLILFLFKNKIKTNYPIINKDDIEYVLKKENFNNPFDELGDFIFSQYLNENFEKNDFLKAVQLLNITINCFVK